jgi:4-amino-4-deoxychorismate lyase
MNSLKFPITFVNGQISSSVSVADRGLAYGDGLFETILIDNGQLHLWSYHHARLLKGLNFLQITVESQRLRYDIDSVLEFIPDLKNAFYVLKIIVTRGHSGRGYQPDETRSNIIISVSQFSQQQNKRDGVKVHLCEQKLPLDLPWAGLKTLNQLSYVLASQERKNTDFDEGILLSTENHIIEATARNIFIVKGEQLFTPLLDRVGVDGVFKNYLIDKLLPQVGLSCDAKELDLGDLLSADEVFLTNSITGIWPITELAQGNENISQWPVGTVTRSLQSMCPLLA